MWELTEDEKVTSKFSFTLPKRQGEGEQSKRDTISSYRGPMGGEVRGGNGL